MPINSIYLAKFECGNHYHVFNRSHSNLILFSKGADYRRFIDKTEFYLSDYLDFYSYSLIPNHFHYFVKVKDIDSNVYENKYEDVDGFLSNEFRKLFISHTKHKNRSEDRHGGLFCTPFRRRLVNDPAYFEQLFYYIHWNHVHHGLSESLEDYTYSSYLDYKHNLDSFINKDLGYAWFGGKEVFLKKHSEHKKYNEKFKFDLE